MRNVRATLVLLAVGLTWSDPRVAHACSCGWPDIGPFPADGSVSVPTNTLIWLDGGSFDSQDTFRLLDATGAEVALTRHTVTVPPLPPEAPAMYVLVPDEPLDADQEYVVEIRNDPITRFRTASTADSQAPDLPVELGRTSSYAPADACPEILQVSFDLEFDGVLAVMDRERSSELQLDPPAGDITHLSAEPYLALGRAWCLANWLEAEPGAVTTVRFGSFDMAGNFSGWTADTEVVMPEADGCGCASDSDQQPLSLLLSLCCLPLLGRARSSRRATCPSGSFRAKPQERVAAHASVRQTDADGVRAAWPGGANAAPGMHHTQLGPG